jgi:hypothetical protein
MLRMERLWACDACGARHKQWYDYDPENETPTISMPRRWFRHGSGTYCERHVVITQVVDLEPLPEVA